MKRIISMLTALCMILGVVVITAPNAGAASNDYATWRQGDSAWNQADAWPEQQYPNATERKMSGVGCLVTSLAMLLRHYNVVTETDVTKFNPWVLNEKLKAVDGFDRAANLVFSSVEKVYPRFRFVASQNYSAETLQRLYANGYACMVTVDGSSRGSHYIAVKAVNGNDIQVMDPASDKTHLYEYGNVYEIFYYAIDGIADTSAGKAVVQVTKSSNLKTLPCSQGTDRNSKTVRKTKVGERLTIDAARVNSVGNLWYQTTSKLNGKSCTCYVYAGDTKIVSDPVAVSNVNYPKHLRCGSAYSVYGTVISTLSNITSVTVGVYNSSGVFVTGASTTLNAKSYDIHNVDSKILFNILPAGQYTYQITVNNAAGSHIAVNQPFAVG